MSTNGFRGVAGVGLGRAVAAMDGVEQGTEVGRGGGGVVVWVGARVGRGVTTGLWG